MRRALGWEFVTGITPVGTGSAVWDPWKGQERAGSCQAVPGAVSGFVPGFVPGTGGLREMLEPSWAREDWSINSQNLPTGARSSLLPVRMLLALSSPPASPTLNTTGFSCFTSALFSVQKNSQLPFVPRADSPSPSLPAQRIKNQIITSLKAKAAVKYLTHNV